MISDTSVFIPYWIEAALKRNSCSPEVCLNYTKLRQFVSLDDAVGFLALQETKSITRKEGNEVVRTLFSMWSESAEGAHAAEFQQAVVPMSRSIELEKDLLARLSLKDNSAMLGTPTNGQIDQENVYYKQIDLGGITHGVVIYPGFVEFIHTPENEFKFVVDQLKVFYVYLKSYQVSLMPVFRKYLYLLSARSKAV